MTSTENISSKLWLDFWNKNPGYTFGSNDLKLRSLKHFHELNIKAGSNILVPLCGKNIDMLNLYSMNYKIIGIELSKIAIKNFFLENKLKFSKTIENGHTLYSTIDGKIKIYCENIFDINQIPLCEGFYDVGSLIAVPKEKRKYYVSIIKRFLSNGAKGILSTLTYHSINQYPPYSIDDKEVSNLYHPGFSLENLESGSLDSDFIKNIKLGNLKYSIYNIRCNYFM